MENLEGEGIMDSLKNGWEKTKDVFRGKRGLSNKAQETLNRIGTQKITGLTIIRIPIEKELIGVLDLISLGKFTQGQMASNYDKIFHLGLICNLENTKVIMEKVDIVNISQSFSVSKETEYLNIQYNGITLNELVDKTVQRIGGEHFYIYSAFGGKNCQDFCANLLITLGVYTEPTKQFVYQSMEIMLQHVPKYLPFVAKKITDLAQIGRKLMGSGIRMQIARKHLKFHNKNKKLSKQDFEHWLINLGGSIFFITD